MVFAFTAVFCNLLFMGGTALIERWESRTSRIPKRKRYTGNNPQESFLYLQDFPTITWGDTVGLSFVDFGVMMLLGSTLPQAKAIIPSSIAVAVFVTFCYHLFSLHLLPYPDSMYPAMKVTSWTGRVHLLYMAIQLTVVSSGLWTLGLLAAGKIAWSPEIAVGVALAFFGGVFYEATWIFGIKKNKRFTGFWKRLFTHTKSSF